MREQQFSLYRDRTRAKADIPKTFPVSQIQHA